MLTDVIIANQGYAKMMVDAAESLDEVAIKVLNRERPAFLLPFKMIEIDGETEIRYEITTGTRMEYMDASMSFKELSEVLKCLIAPFLECEEWLLDYRHLLLDKKHILFDKQSKTAKYIYCPVDSVINDETVIKKFFEDYIISVNLKDNQNMGMALLRLLKNNDSTLISLYEYLKKFDNGQDGETQRNVSKPITSNKVAPKNDERPTNASQQINIQPSDQKENIKSGAGSMPGKTPIESGLENALFGEQPVPEKKEIKSKDKPGGLLGNFGFKKKTENGKQVPVVESKPVAKAIKPEKPVRPTKDTGERPISPATLDVTISDDFGNDSYVEKEIELKLIDSSGISCADKIRPDFSKGSFTIGRFDKAGIPQADFNFPMELSFIGRRHIRLEKSGDRYYIIDLDSKNKTFLNGTQLIPNMQYEFKRGDRIGICTKNQIVYQVV